MNLTSLAVLIGLALAAFPIQAFSAPIEQLLPITYKTTLSPGSSYGFTFRLYDGPTVSANKLWQEGPVTLKIKTDQTLKHILGSVTPFTNGTNGAVDFSQQMWVQITAGRKTFWLKLIAQPYALGGTQGPDGPQGPQGIQGPPGEQGPAGEFILAGIECPNNQYLVGFNPDGSLKCRKLPQMISHRFEVVVNNTANWLDAETICSGLGGYLATITSKAESDELRTLIQVNPEGEYWLGGTDQATELSWVWSTGETWDYTLWIPTFPREATNLNCLVYRRVSTLDGWSDWDCTQVAKGFVCEYEY